MAKVFVVKLFWVELIAYEERLLEWWCWKMMKVARVGSKKGLPPEEAAAAGPGAGHVAGCRGASVQAPAA